MTDTESAGAAMAASGNEDLRPAAEVFGEIADYIDRYAARLSAGPAVREFSAPINRNRYDPDLAGTLRGILTSLAQTIRTGIAQPEADWPIVLAPAERAA